MKILSQLIKAINPLQVVGNTDIEITDVINDSRQAREGVLFVRHKCCQLFYGAVGHG